MSQGYWVIEHPTRGCFDRWDWSPTGNGDWRPFFHYEVARTHESIERFYHKSQAELELAKIAVVVRGCYLFEMRGSP